MMSRVERIEKELQHQVGRIVQQDLNDPGIGFITITKVKMTPDLREANIYFTTMGTDKSLDEAKNALDRATGFVRRLIGENIRMKFIPHIKFIHDDSQEKQVRIDKIIDKIHKEKEKC